MKKFIALAIAVVMLAALAVPAFALSEGALGSDTGAKVENAGSTTIEYTVGASYEFVIDATITMNETDTTNVPVTVNKLNKLDDKVLEIYTGASVALKSTDAQAGTEDVTVNFSTPKVTFTENVDTVTGPATKNIIAEWDEAAPTVAGYYSATITYTAQIVDAE